MAKNNSDEKIANKKIRLFISYSRRDFGKIEKLYEALSGDDELDVFLDQHDIAAAEDWKQRLDGLIRSSDTILFAVSRDSVASDICQWEIDLATQLNKRIIPVIINDVADEDVPKEIARLNYVFARTDKELIPALQSIGDALKIDIDWIREHTRLADMAHRWEQASKLGAQPLRGKELEAAEQWLSNQPYDAPAPTELQRKYIYESRKFATKRQRMTVMGSIAAMLIVGVLAAIAFVQRNAAIEGERRAEEALRTATEAANTMVFDLAQEFSDSPVPSNIIESILGKARKLQDALGKEFEEDAGLQRSKAVALIELGDIYRRFKSIDKARAAYSEALEIIRKLAAADETVAEWQGDLSFILRKIGDVKLDVGDVEGARKVYEEGLMIIQKLVAFDENNAEWQGNLSASLNKIGNMKLRLGDAEGALKAYEEGLEISRKLVALDENNTEWQNDLSVSLNKIGKLKLHSGDTEGTHKAFEESLVISRKLAALGENNTEWQRGLSISLHNIAEIRQRAGDRKGALKLYEEGLEIRRKLVALDESNTEWQNDLSIGLEKIGNIKLLSEDADGALRAYEDSLAISRKLADLDKNNTQWQRGLSFSLNHIAGIKQRAGDKKGALKLYDEGIEIHRKLVALDENNAHWLRDLSINLVIIGNIKLDAEDADGALRAFEESLVINRKLVAQDGNNTQWQRDLSMSLEKIGGIKLDSGDVGGALKNYEFGLEIARKLVSLDENNADWQHDLLVSLTKIGNLKLDADDTHGGLKAYEEAPKVALKLVSLDENNADWQQEMTNSMYRLYKVYSRLKDHESAYRLGKDLLRHTSGLVERFPEHNMVLSIYNQTAQKEFSKQAGTLGYYTLHDGEFIKSEKLSREAISLDPKSLWMKTNLAHALMFQNKTDEARVLYLKHLGEAVSDEQTWEQIILSDFKDLRKKGLIHPMMEEIEALFNK